MVVGSWWFWGIGAAVWLSKEDVEVFVVYLGGVASDVGVNLHDSVTCLRGQFPR